TAKDLAILAYHLIKKHPDVLEYTNSTSVSIKSGTPLAETFEAYNYSLPGSKYGIEGVDGLKTGSSPQAGFNSIVTAKRGDTR
ncbi:D-alanyl-D-alanine carboxypeptidase, partial [Streptococcus pyogenes]